MLLLLIASLPAMAQSAASEIEMADAFRAEGKIYVVIAVILLIFAGFIAYVVRIDRKVTRLEKELDMDR
ncbi:MAG: CcmD family protein [Cyclobacteriaceae bacterium]